MAVTDPPTTASAARAAIGRRARVADVAIWLVITTPISINAVAEHQGGPAVDVIGAVLTFGLIVMRRRWPTTTLTIGLVSAVAATAITSRPTVMLPAVVVLMFNASVRSDRRRSIIVWVAGLAMFITTVALLNIPHFFGPELLAGLAWATLAVAAGDAVRSRREAMAAAVERAERAERSRDGEAKRRVAEERLHIARELHDLVAHRIAIVNVQAGVAAHLMRTKPDAAEQALATVRSSARLVLDELAGMLSVLRTDDDNPAPVASTPTLEEVPALIDSFAAAGLSVTFESSGEHRPVTATTGLAVYRTIQEALTNAHKHGDGSARVRILNHPSDIEVSIVNRVSDDATRSDTSGFGLVGMRERVNAAGGTVTTNTGPDGTFAVDAQFPVAATDHTG